MGAVGDELAASFEAANGQLLEALRGLSDEQWKRTTSGEGWSIGVTAHHVAGTRDTVMQMVNLLSTGPGSIDFTPEMLNHANAEHAREFADVGRDETIAIAERTGPSVAAALRAIPDEGYAKGAMMSGMGRNLTARQMVEGALIGHIHGHLESIKAAANT